ncbi:hypothetical protein [Actinomyces naeslundii]|uniref:hypothetical protein n=1 Tax=Actinomyces naeslundii TaxID=1655 RepID=UPI000B0E24A5|nr:hypothetical protein [Actinomyces naeslundii]
MVRRHRRAGAWSPPLVAAMARSLAREGRREAGRLTALADRARRINETGYAAEFDQASAASAAVAATVEAAALYWVAAPMARLAMDASQDIPAINGADAPAQAGLMVMAEPLPAWDTSAIGGLALRDGDRTDVPHNEAVPVDALTWNLDPHPSGIRALTIELMCRPTRLPLPLLEHQSNWLVPFTRLRTLIPASLDAAQAVGPDGAPVDPAHVGVMAWLQAAWTLMTTPNLTQTTVVAGTGKPRTTRTNDTTGRGHDADDDGVTVIDLHPQRRRLITTEDTAVAGDGPRRRLTTRHVVRGHWTHQPHGKGRALRRLQWVDDYIRGPQGAPLTTRTHVWAWRHQ